MVVLEPKIVDFVVVLESTANMVAHWDTIKKNYIQPALEYFNGKAATAMDYMGNNGNSHYGYVLVRSGDPGLEPLTSSAVIQSPSLFLRKLDTIGFSGGGSEKHCLVAEGLGRALKVFDDIASKRGQRRTYEDIARTMGSKSIHLSVMSSHHIRQMKEIYRIANQPKSIMNYAQDQRHLVLISGFDLPTEQSPVKVEPNDEKKPETIRPLNVVTSSVSSPASQASNPVSTFNNPQLPPQSHPYQVNPVSTPTTTLSQSSFPVPASNQKMTANNQGGPQLLNTVTGANLFSHPSVTNTPVSIMNSNEPAPNNHSINQPRNMNMRPLVSFLQPSMNQQQQPISLSQPMNQPTQQQINQSQMNSTPQMSQPTQQMGQPTQQMGQPTQQMGQPTQQMGQPTQQMGQQTQQMGQQTPQMGQQTQQMGQPTNPQYQTYPQQPQPSQRPVWVGMLEWTEKRAVATGEERTVHRLNCEMVLSHANVSEDGMLANYWPKSLNMQLVPRIILSDGRVKSFLRQMPIVNIKLSPHDQSLQLCKLMTQRWMGVINIPVQNGMQPPESRVILVIHKNGGQMVGLVSRESQQLIGAIKQSIKMRNTTSVSAQQPQQPAGHEAVYTPDRRVQPNVINPIRTNPTRMTSVQMQNGMMANQPRQQMEYANQQQQMVHKNNMPNTTTMQQQQQSAIRPQLPQNIGGQQRQFSSANMATQRIMRPVMNQSTQPHAGMRFTHQQAPRQMPLNRATHNESSIQSLLSGNNVNQSMNQPQQRPGMINPAMNQQQGIGFMQNQQMRHQMNPHVMNMNQQRFGMQ